MNIKWIINYTALTAVYTGKRGKQIRLLQNSRCVCVTRMNNSQVLANGKGWSLFSLAKIQRLSQDFQVQCTLANFFQTYSTVVTGCTAYARLAFSSSSTFRRCNRRVTTIKVTGSTPSSAPLDAKGFRSSIWYSVALSPFIGRFSFRISIC